MDSKIQDIIFIFYMATYLIQAVLNVNLKKYEMPKLHLLMHRNGTLTSIYNMWCCICRENNERPND